MREFVEVIQGADHYPTGPSLRGIVAKYAKIGIEVCEEM